MPVQFCAFHQHQPVDLLDAEVLGANVCNETVVSSEIILVHNQSCFHQIFTHGSLRIGSQSLNDGMIDTDIQTVIENSFHILFAVRWIRNNESPQYYDFVLLQVFDSLPRLRANVTLFKEVKILLIPAFNSEKHKLEPRPAHQPCQLRIGSNANDSGLRQVINRVQFVTDNLFAEDF